MRRVDINYLVIEMNLLGILEIMINYLEEVEEVEGKEEIYLMEEKEQIRIIFLQTLKMQWMDQLNKYHMITKEAQFYPFSLLDFKSRMIKK